jgi:hypothetical protein
MKPQRLQTIRFPHGAGRLSPLDRLAESLSLERDDSNWERIRQMREAYFADVEALRKSGTVKLPK